MKACTKCASIKPFDAFYLDKRTVDGRYSACKECARAATKAWKKENADRVRLSFAAWRKANLDLVRTLFAAWRARNPERLKEYYRRWCGPSNARRRAKLRAQQCACCRPADFISIYAEARRLGMHVDHRIPISKGGLHCLSNLQLLTPVENMRKGAKLPEIAA